MAVCSGAAPLLASAGYDKTVRIFEVEDRAAPSLKYTLDNATNWVYSVAFSADSKLLASASGNKVRVYTLANATDDALAGGSMALPRPTPKEG